MPATALAQLAAAIGTRGQWPGSVVADTPPHEERRDMAAPLTALGMLALRDVNLPGADDILRRSREHLEQTVLPGGWWRYYADIPPDTDDSAMCALALGPAHPLHAQTASSLAATRLPDGRFPTWIEPGWNQVIDAVPNAHIVAVIGPGTVTEAAVAWLNEVVATERETAASAYYPDPLDLHVAIARAVAAGVSGLQPALTRAAERAGQRLQRGGDSAYRTAQAMVVAAAGGLDGRVLTAAADYLLTLREAQGTWPADTLFVAGNSTRPGKLHYRSWAVVTALCVRALTPATAGTGA